MGRDAQLRQIAKIVAIVTIGKVCQSGERLDTDYEAL
jgi:hypothetical protein